MADFMLGYIRSDSVNPAHTSTDLYNYWVALSANDDFKITPRLTLNFGLRWDYFQRYKQKDDQIRRISSSTASSWATPSPPRHRPSAAS